MKATLFAFLIVIGISSSIHAADIIRLQPKPSDALLANPGMGWQTFHRFADEDKNLAGLPSGSAYFRFYWREIEAKDGNIDFARFDGLLEHAQKAGQKLAFRVMCTGSGNYMDVPAWLKEQGCSGTEFTFEGRKHWVPDFTDPKFQKTHYRLIRELGKRYDGHPDLDLLDIGSVGLWAEWHMSGTKAVDTGKPVPLPPTEVRLAIIDEWVRAFPQTRKVVLIGSEEAMAMTVPQRLGWRADCLGDMGGFSKTWNHMDHFYLQQVQKTGAGDAWKHAPVAFESCWDMRKWTDSGWDVRNIFDYALKCHASYINNKSAPIPDGTREEIERLLRELGYRLVLQNVELPAEWKRTTNVEIATSWENIGVAPPYVDYLVALQLQPLRSPGAPKTLVSGTSMRGWLPGPRAERLAFKVPAEIAPGEYVARIGLVHPKTHKAEVRLAIDIPPEQGWYRLGKVTVQ